MGMSASQARLLSLTARQSNLEFEGQQINQQRTNLSSQSANYYNSLLSMTVPTPPSTDDYTKIKYTFTIGGNAATISQVLPNSGTDAGTYSATYTTSLSAVGIQDNSAYKVTSSTTSKTGLKTAVGATDVYNSNNSYFVQTYRKLSSDTSNTTDKNETQYHLLTSSSATDSRLTAAGTTYYNAKGYQVDSATALTSGKLNDGFTALVAYNDATDSNDAKYALVDVQLADSAAFTDAKKNNEQINQFQENTSEKTYGSDKHEVLQSSNSAVYTTVGSEYVQAFANSGLNADDYYQYTASSGVRFAKKSDVDKSANNSQLSVMTSATGSITTTQQEKIAKASVEFDSAGRISTITDATTGASYTMTANTETDNDAYEDAYNKYTYNQYVYDQKQNDINSHIKILQAQDKNLELRLSQLNTEHSAIQTEIEAVNKVLSKNIETSFKTFNA